MEHGYEVSAPTTQWDITPYYMATTACDLFHVARGASDKVKHDWHKYFMYCVVIELGLKAVLLNNNNTKEQKTENQKKIGHDLTILLNAAMDKLPTKFFNDQEKKAVNKISPLFRDKALEYLEIDMLVALLSGGRNIPPIADLDKAAGKVAAHLEANKHFRASQTT